MNTNLNNSFWNKIKTLIKLYHLNFLFDVVGSDFLSEDEMTFLEDNLGKTKLDFTKIPLLDKIFAFGQIAQKVGFENANKITKKDLESWLKENKVKVNTQLEKIKAQAYLDVLSKQFQIEKDLRQGILNESNKEEFKMSDIVDYIKGKFEDWSYLKQSIAYVSESALNEGKVEEIKSQAGKEGESDPIVYKVPIQDEKLCPNCRKAYLNSDGNPRLFRLSELVANGTNIGKKPNAWLPTLGMMHPHCYDKETEVLTNEGWKFFKDLTGKELCLTFDIETENVKWSPIINCISYLYNGPMSLYEHSEFSLCVTPEHNQVISRQIIKEGPRGENGKRTKINLGFKNIICKDSEIHETKPRFFKSIPNYIGEDKKEIEICGYKFDTYNFCAFLGYYLSEGNINYDYNQNTCEIKISQNKDRYFDDILKYSRLCFGEKVSGTGKQAIYIYINKELGKWFKNFGYSYEKYIPEEIKNLDKKYLQIFLEKYINGDGNRKKVDKIFNGYHFNSIQESICTSSYKMASDLSELIMKIGKAVKIDIQDNRGKVIYKKDGSKIETKRICYILRIKDSIYSACKKQIIDYNDYVYCVEVQDNHTLFVKRKGHITISGNCRCLLQYFEELPNTSKNDYEFDESKQRYILKEKVLSDSQRKVQRKSKVKITIGDKNFEV